MSHLAHQEIGVLVDFDGTLTRIDTCMGFVQYGMRHSVRSGLLVGCVLPVLVLGRSVPRWRPGLVSLALWLVTVRRSSQAIARMLQTYGSALATRDLLRPEMTARLHWHVRQGHRVVVVSASCATSRDESVQPGRNNVTKITPGLENLSLPCRDILSKRMVAPG